MTISASLAAMLRGSVWARGLSEEQMHRVERDTLERTYAAGAVICRRDEPALHWLGVIDGMAKVDNVAADGRVTTFSCMSPGGWFGEGSVLKKEPRPYEVVALHDTRMALMPIATFDWLLATSLPFNRFLIDQLNARLGQFIALVESSRMHDVAGHVAHCLAELFNPQLNPQAHGVPGAASPQTIALSQEELGRLSGLSRQIANRALHQLESAGLVRVSYGAIDVNDVDGLRRFSRSH